MKNIDSMQTNSILGCGKLDFPLTFYLLNEVYYIKGSIASVLKLIQVFERDKISKFGYFLD